MDAQTFWNVVGAYNQRTSAAQVVLLLLVLAAAVLSYFNKVRWAAKLALGVVHLFIGVAFFACHGAAPVQKYFALPLFLICGILFLYESYRNRNDVLRKPNGWQCLMLLLYLFYPMISFLLGHRFPQIVTHIMPCPVASLGIIICSVYKAKNKLLLVLLSVWGLTGIKSAIFNVYEDIILLTCGLYGLALLYKETRAKKEK